MPGDLTAPEVGFIRAPRDIWWSLGVSEGGDGGDVTEPYRLLPRLAVYRRSGTQLQAVSVSFSQPNGPGVGSRSEFSVDGLSFLLKGFGLSWDFQLPLELMIGMEIRHMDTLIRRSLASS